MISRGKRKPSIRTSEANGGKVRDCLLEASFPLRLARTTGFPSAQQRRDLHGCSKFHAAFA